ncbi:MAG: hypothetical protein QOJ96_1351 [Alphaproteobacteria bacterium]|jgi:hypothetical protein|nr:hypothetical protein [Alphaproteobacteria bacterium]
MAGVNRQLVVGNHGNDKAELLDTSCDLSNLFLGMYPDIRRFGRNFSIAICWIWLMGIWLPLEKEPTI